MNISEKKDQQDKIETQKENVRICCNLFYEILDKSNEALEKIKKRAEAGVIETSLECDIYLCIQNKIRDIYAQLGAFIEICKSHEDITPDIIAKVRALKYTASTVLRTLKKIHVHT